MNADLMLETANRLLGPGTPLHGSLRNSGWYVGADIPAKKLAGAREGFAPFDEGREDPVVLYDGTVFGSAKRGVLFTTRALYWSITSAEDGFSEVKGRLPLGAIKRLGLDGERLMVNEEAIGTIVKPDRKEARAILSFFEGLAALATSEEAGLAPALAPMARAEAGAPRAGTGPLRQAPDEVFAAIRGLKALYEEGALTEAEYVAKKQELLQRI